MRKIALIGCCKKKLGENEPTKLYYAKDIYQGNSFKKSKNDGVSMFGCEDYFILSAKHKLLDKDKKISYYNLTLNDFTVSEKKEWAEEVFNKLNTTFDIKNTEFYIFAGANYYKYLKNKLNCVVFRYENSNSITFDIKEKNTI